jgi:hypothetical protein
LIADGTLAEKNGYLLFTKDVEFSSPSAAAAVVHGGSANGLIVWKTKDGKTLKQLDEHETSGPLRPHDQSGPREDFQRDWPRDPQSTTT